MATSVAEKYIEEIAEALWNGRAVVMVGAGFSRNATKVSKNVAPVPLWGNLAETMKQKLGYSGKTSADALSLASQYEAQYGRQRMEQFLRDQIPDLQYLPGEAHKGLVSLPWRDIFTTNYDTLLERADSETNGIAYDIVQTSNDIAMCRPSHRIVKLHGSFSLTGSIVFTEEDYRTYPALHAPFVNMVQQSMMENVFCLLGFSGTDLNFLCWLGWVRDNLGKNMPKVYLCGLFDMPEAQRMDFARKNVSIVDFDSLAGEIGHFDEDERQKNAVCKFLQCLQDAEPPSDMEWGCGKERCIGKSMANQWRQERETYPGWVIAPYQIRRRMEEDYRGNLMDLLEESEATSLADQLAYAYEFSWRKDRMLDELDEMDVKICIDVLKSVHLFSPLTGKRLSTAEASLDVGEEERSYLEKAWVGLALAVLRWMRENDSEGIYPELKGILNKVCPMSVEWMSCLHYENCLRFLGKYDRKSTLSELEEWKKERDKPFDDFWIAAVYAEIDEIEKAGHLVTEALSEIRKRLHGIRNRNTRLESLSSWGRYLLHVIRLGRFPDAEGFLSGNPQQEIDFLANRVMTWAPGVRIAHSASSGSGRAPERSSFGSRSWNMPAFSWYRLHEAAPLPANGIHSKMCREAFWALWHSSPRYSSSWLLRMADAEDIGAVLGQWHVACMSRKDASFLLSLAMQGLKNAILYLKNNPDIVVSSKDSAVRRTMECMTEILSRLCSRLSEEERDEVFLLAVRCYKDNACRGSSSFWLYLGHLWKKLFFAMSRHELRKHLAELLDLPLLGEPGFDVETSRTCRQMPLHYATMLGESGSDIDGYLAEWPEPFSFIDSNDLTEKDNKGYRSGLRNKIDRLLPLVENGLPEARMRAMRRMAVLYGAKLLDAEQCRRFGMAIWQRTAGNKLPDCTGYLWSYCLAWPRAAEEHAADRLRTFLKQGTFETWRIDESGNDFVRSGIKEYEHEWQMASKCVLVESYVGEQDLRIEWTQEELHAFLAKAIRYMYKLLDDGAFLAEKRSTKLDSVIETLAISVFPFLQDLKSDEWNSLYELLGKMEKKHASRVILCMSVSLQKKDEQKAEKIIQEGLVSVFPQDVACSYRAIGIWKSMHCMQQGTDNDVPQTLLEQAVRGILLRRSMFFLPEILKQTADLIHRFPSSFTDEMVDDLCQAADRLYVETQSVFGECIDPLVGAGWDSEEIIEILSRTTHLFKHLHEWYRLGGKSEPEIIERWRKRCMESVLPEVKRWA